MASILPAKDVIRKSRAENDFSLLQFPSDIGLHAMVITIRKYEYSRIGEVKTSDHFIRPRNVTTDAIVLPIPENIQDSFNIRVGGADIGIHGALFANMVDSIENSPTKTAATAGEHVAQTIMNSYNDPSGAYRSLMDFISGAGSGIKYLSRQMIDRLGTGVGAGMDIGYGTSINPYTSISFDGVDLKTHQFNWKLSPKSAQESDNLKNITNKLKRASLPSYRELSDAEVIKETVLSRAVLEYPSVLDIFFVGANPEYFLYFKPCMISNLSMNYAPNGLSFVTGGKPSFVNLSMSLTEMKIHTKEDHPDTLGV